MIHSQDSVLCRHLSWRPTHSVPDHSLPTWTRTCQECPEFPQPYGCDGSIMWLL
jgi:hypothetical protein